MGGYKFNIDPSPLKDETIEKHRNFNKVLTGYKRMTHPLYRTPLYRHRRTFLGLLLVLAIAFVLSESREEQKENKVRVSPDTVTTPEVKSDSEKDNTKSKEDKDTAPTGSGIQILK